MWLLPLFSLVSSASARCYYRLTLTGKAVPRRGPLLLVANHPNSLLDPVLVSAAARRPVRFLAKAPLFSDRWVGWLIRGAGSIPVYRKADDPALSGRNVEMFQAVFDALHGGAAVGLFPEGISHSEPSLAPLRTGAARIALGAGKDLPGPFPIVPVGLVLRRKTAFRSAALVVLGEPVEWGDLAGQDSEDRDAVRELTRRIEDGLRRVTVNVDAWEDRPLVECAEAIWAAHHEADPDPAAAIARLEVTTKILARLRLLPESPWPALVRQVAAHAARLERLGLTPADLGRDVRLRTAARWTALRLHLLGLPAFAVALAGWIAFRPPYWLTDILARLGRPPRDVRSTAQLLIGIPVYALWVLVLASVAAWRLGLPVGAAVLLGAPALGLLGLWVRERWRDAWADARSFLLLRSRRRLIRALHERQQALAAQLGDLHANWNAGKIDPPPNGVRS